MIYGNDLIEAMIKAGSIKHTYQGAVNPASLNIRLGNSILVPKEDQVVALGEEVKYDEYKISDENYFLLKSGQFVLATTVESFSIPINVAAFVQGRSSIGRACLTIQNAGFIDPGFHGHITLELKNEGPFDILLVPGYPVGQIIFEEASDVSRPYSGKYCGQVEATGSRMQEDIYKPGNQKEIGDEEEEFVIRPVDPYVPEAPEMDLDEIYKDNPDGE